MTCDIKISMSWHPYGEPMYIASNERNDAARPSYHIEGNFGGENFGEFGDSLQIRLSFSQPITRIA